MLHGFGQGLAQHCVLYILATVLFVMGMRIPIADVMVRVFTR